MGRAVNETDLSLYYVTGRQLLPEGEDFYANVEEACRGGITILQLREKDGDTRDILEIATKVKVITDKYNVPFLMNDRLDISLALGIGLHVGQSDFPPAVARKLLGPDAIIGVSVNTIAEVQQVIEEDVADYVGIGPVWGTQTKTNLNPLLGARGLRDILQVMGKSRIGTVAIGGLTTETIPNLLRQAVAHCPGANPSEPEYRPLGGVAVVSAIAASRTPRPASEELVALVRSGQQTATFLAAPAPSSPSKGILVQFAAQLLSKVRAGKPLVHHITNSVVQNDTANLTLAFGGSPIMSSEALESAALSHFISALLLNMGTPNPAQIASFHAAGKAANSLGADGKGKRKPVVFDPVGVGATPFRMKTADDLLNAVHVDIIKGNAGEIGALSGLTEVKSRGVDSVGKGFENPIDVVRSLALREKVVVAMSGESDYISRGGAVIEIRNGHRWQGEITGSGCMASTAVACFAGAFEPLQEAGLHESEGYLIATVAGLLAYNIAAEIAAESPSVSGPNSFRAALIDSVYNLKAEDILARAKLEIHNTSNA